MVTAVASGGDRILLFLRMRDPENSPEYSDFISIYAATTGAWYPCTMVQQGYGEALEMVEVGSVYYHAGVWFKWRQQRATGSCEGSLALGTGTRQNMESKSEHGNAESNSECSEHGKQEHGKKFRTR